MRAHRYPGNLRTPLYHTAGRGWREPHRTDTRAFLTRMAHGLFSLHWQSHALHYRIGIEIDGWLARDLPAVINGHGCEVSTG